MGDTEESSKRTADAAKPADDVERMNDLEYLMWLLESDQHLTSQFANLTMLDSVPDIERLRARLDRAARIVPRLRKRVEEAPARIAAPCWRDDPDFDIDRHFRVSELPKRYRRPGGLEQFACDLDSQQLPRDRPLWEFTLVIGLDDDRAAMVQRMDHTVTDGEGGLRMSMAFIDLERDAPAPPPVEEPTATTGGGLPFGGLIETIGHTTRKHVDRTRSSIGEVLDHVRHPTRLARTGADVIDVASSLARQARSVDRRLSPLWTERSMQHSLATMQFPLDRVIDASRSAGVTVNDLFTAAVLEGAVQVHVAANTVPTDLRVAVPVSTRKGASGGNLFAPILTVLPASPNLSPAERLAAVSELMTRAKGESSVGAIAPLASGARLIPTPVLTQAGKWVTSNIDVVLSNVRAAPFDTFMGGALIEANYPLGPLTGAAVNVTTMSYRGMLDVGVHTDDAAVQSADELADAILRAFEILTA
nr:putative wax ester synthase/acyl-CoA:diacylglycerol acyltransferase [uncultured bacterium]